MNFTTKVKLKHQKQTLPFLESGEETKEFLCEGLSNRGEQWMTE